MRRELKVVGALLLVAAIALLIVPAAHATMQWKQGSGWFDMSIVDQVKVWNYHDFMIAHYWGGGGYCYGTLEGKWIHDGMGEWDSIDLTTNKFSSVGTWDTPDGCTFAGVSGKLTVLYWGNGDLETGVFQGQWVIVSGTGGLANLKGHGIMWTTLESAQLGIAYYTIDYCFGS